jgi:hypoxanthine phosphoribosyltransferase
MRAIGADCPAGRSARVWLHSLTEAAPFLSRIGPRRVRLYCMTKIGFGELAPRDLPGNYQLEYPASAIAEQVLKLGAAVTSWAAQCTGESGRDIIAVPVLRGGIFFFADLVRSIAASVDILPLRTAAYRDNEEQNETVSVTGDLSPVRGRHVLLIDEICESGRTFEKLHLVMNEAGAMEVRSAVLILRATGKQVWKPTWVGFEHPGTAWLVGYGMDDRDRWRNLPSIYSIPPGQSE